MGGAATIGRMIRVLAFQLISIDALPVTVTPGTRSVDPRLRQLVKDSGSLSDCESETGDDTPIPGRSF